MRVRRNPCRSAARVTAFCGTLSPSIRRMQNGPTPCRRQWCSTAPSFIWSRRSKPPSANCNEEVLTAETRSARDGEEFGIHSNGGDWIVEWQPASVAPQGTPHGAMGICLTAEGGLVLISNDGERWGLPGGRPEEHETWEQTLHREVLEEACAIILRAKLLGFSRGRCLTGHEAGLVLVRSVWRAEVDLAPWNPRFEIAHRRVVPAEEWSAHLWVDDGFGAIFRRAFADADLT